MQQLMIPGQTLQGHRFGHLDKKEPRLASLSKYVQNWKDNTFTPIRFHLLRKVILYICIHFAYYRFGTIQRNSSAQTWHRITPNVLQRMTQRQMIPKWKYYMKEHCTTCRALMTMIKVK
jgi:hypothetical protein